MRSANGEHELFVLVKNKPITEYNHEGSTYVEGRKGTPYEIVIKNNTPNRHLYVLSVDGKSVLDGQPAGMNSRGYVVNGYSTASIPGWVVDSGTAAKFVFQPKERSYAAEMGESTENTGVIGVLIFDERVRPVIRHQVMLNEGPYRFSNNYPFLRSSPGAGGGPISSGGWGGSDGASGGYGSALNGAGEQCLSFNASSASLGEVKTSGGIEKARGIVFDSYTPEVPVQEIGTGFGKATNFQTTVTDFDRATPGTARHTLAIYYDTKKGLERRGVVVKEAREPVKPNPFPAAGCKTPGGWRR